MTVVKLSVYAVATLNALAVEPSADLVICISVNSKFVRGDASVSGIEFLSVIGGNNESVFVGALYGKRNSVFKTELVSVSR